MKFLYNFTHNPAQMLSPINPRESGATFYFFIQIFATIRDYLKNIGDNLKKKVAIFVDWDNLRKDIAKIQNYSKYTDKQSIIDFQKKL